MRSRVAATYLLLGASLAAIAVWRATPVRGSGSSDTGSSNAGSPASWNRQTAARSLDDREIWWQNWPRARKDHGTLCISCHTVVPYALARPGLRRDLAETQMTAPEKTMMDSVEKRVSHWSEMVPFYSDAKSGPGKTAESHATEAVLNAVILASCDTRLGHLRSITRTAFDEAWALQEQTGERAGGWKWQDFHLGPWESAESAYQGAALLMVEAVNAPDGYAREPEARRHLDQEREYLRRQYAAQPLINQLYILWASAKEPGLLTHVERKDLLATIRGKQQQDGGWRLMALDHKDRIDQSPEPMESDGYATGLAVLAIEESGVSRRDKTLQRGLEWLTEHQQKNGTWTASSMNRQRDPESDAYLFMSDAATGYAVLALEKAQ
jgi:squalene-hopene/tetraprenyl-beta-curcumene cyclase